MASNRYIYMDAALEKFFQDNGWDDFAAKCSGLGKLNFTSLAGFTAEELSEHTGFAVILARRILREVSLLADPICVTATFVSDPAPSAQSDTFAPVELTDADLVSIEDSANQFQLEETESMFAPDDDLEDEEQEEL